ncbi:hypothetical protein CRG98_010801 [Punica granatum]|uniref:DYW domain-containing protein n=1 Tax=Punica granatum TaxID=22663 RepID=A0A2I0KJR4_PUNGR|nr:hypothetical protein CRG98_010801 [Punica granatum]
MSSAFVSSTPPPSLAVATGKSKSAPLPPPSLQVAHHTLSERVHIPSHVYQHPAAVLLELCTSLRELHQIVPLVLKSGLYGEHLFQTKLVSLFCKYGSLAEAARVFDPINDKLDVLYHTMLKGYAKSSSLDTALSFFCRMKHDGVVPIVYNVTYLLKVCGDGANLRRGREIHGQLIVSGFGSNVFAMTGLVNMYAKCRLVKEAHKMFDRMPHRDLVSWNTIIAGYAQNCMPRVALDLVARMQVEEQQPDSITLVTLLPAVADIGSLRIGKSVHGYAIRAGFTSLVNVSTALLDMYCKCKSIDTARLIFDGIKNRTVVTWNSLIDGYCKRVDLASEIFNNLKDKKTLVSWNAMILGFAQNGRVSEALNLFCGMHSQKMKPDTFTMVSVIPAIAELSVTRHAKWIHGLAIRSCMDSDVYVMTALVDMYAKCGKVDTARKLFDMMEYRHVITWNAMIDGYGTHGLGIAAVELFKEMRKGTVRPNGITFLCVLSACSHSGLVEEGVRFFDSMKMDYNIEPSMDHYGSMVDLLGRAGRLNEAWDFIHKMPIEPGITVYGAMLGACKIHKNVELGEKAADRLFELNPEEGGYHVLLANIYATASMWDKVAKVRKVMEKGGLQKTPGCSLVELRNEVHSFYSGSTDHPQSKRIYAFLETLTDEIKAAGYVPDTHSIHDVEDDVKEQLLSSHSERLAIAFGLLNTSPGTTIHIRKNLRVCGDCHNATKYISLVTGREIIVRDMHRFHHFKDGACSCRDYW